MRKAFLLLLLFIAVFSAAVFLLFNQNIKQQADCNSFSYSSYPESCVVCPPCEVCSSISCQTEEFCKGIGFDRNWYAAIQKRLEETES